MIRIYIPTLNRASLQPTWDSLPDDLKAQAVLVCPTAEVAEHKANGRNLLVFDKVGIAPKRHFIMMHAMKMGYEKIIMLDDDTTLQYRRIDMKIRNCDAGVMRRAMAWIENTLDEVIHCGFGARFLGYADPKEWAEPGRMMQCLAYNVPKVMATGASFIKGVDDLFGIDDFNMTLQLLTKGFPNRVSLTYRYTSRASGAKGGCATWRTKALQTSNATKLKELFPQFVTLRAKKSGMGAGEGEMMDVKIDWKGALKHGLSQGKE
jgi:hypothetical protein